MRLVELVHPVVRMVDWQATAEQTAVEVVTRVQRLAIYYSGRD